MDHPLVLSPGSMLLSYHSFLSLPEQTFLLHANKMTYIHTYKEQTYIKYMPKPCVIHLVHT